MKKLFIFLILFVFVLKSYCGTVTHTFSADTGVPPHDPNYISYVSLPMQPGA
ncbi:hypothetical protein K9K77_03610 [Candidatus Babeliales bacterium]|nr:hypothetical protein [Candidatus Babeliales bacterium]